MQVKPRPEISNLKRNASADQAVHFMNSEEQTASTSPPSEQAWITLTLVLMVLIVGLYGFNERRSEQPNRSAEVVVADQPAAKRPVDALTGDQILGDQGSLTTPRSEYLDAASTRLSDPNERLVRRFYDEVINQQHFALMDDLFADQVAYGDSEPMTTLSLAALKQQLRAKVIGYVGLSYDVEQITTGEDWVHVHWSAVRRRLLSWTEYPPTGEPLVWSGDTVWKVVDGKLVQMRTHNVSKPQPYRTDDDKAQINNSVKKGSLKLAQIQPAAPSPSPIDPAPGLAPSLR